MKKDIDLKVTQKMLDSAVMTDQQFTDIAHQTKYTVNRIKAGLAVRGIPAPSAKTCPIPPSNTGEKENIQGDKLDLFLENGKIKTVLKRTHYDTNCAIVDWVNSVYHESTFDIFTDQDESDPHTVVMSASAACESIFGYGITMKRPNGANFYKTSYDLGDGYGLVCHGGQRNTLLIAINGQGCAAAKPAWEYRLAEFIDKSEQGRITRVDLAHDDFNGVYFNADSVFKMYESGLFQNGNRSPNIELRGNWLNPNGKGRTINIGSRENGLYFRGYEKGKHLGDALSEWFRCEVEIKNTDRIIPTDCLRFPSHFFAAAYPAFSHCSANPERIEITKKTVEASYARTKKWLKHQCGSALNLMQQVEESPEKVLQLVTREGKLPKGITPPSYLYPMQYIHETNER